MIPIVSTAPAVNVLSKIFSGPSAAFMARQAVRDQYYQVLREAGTYFQSQGTAYAQAQLDYMNKTFSDLSPSRNYGQIGPNAGHLAQLKKWLENPVVPGLAPPTVAAGNGQPIVVSPPAPVQAGIGGIPTWLIIAAGIVALVVFTRD